MPNDVLTAAIDALATRRDLSQEQAGAVLGEIMAGNGSEGQIAAFLIALRTKGETVEEIAGPRLGDARARHAGRHAARRPARHRRHRRRAADLQRVDDRGAGRRRRRLRGGQARQPLRDGPQRLGRRAGGAGRPHRPHAGRRRALHRRGRLRVHVRARPPRGHALGHPGAQGARGAHDLQLPRPADQPGRRPPPGRRRLRPRLPRRARRRARPPGLRSRVGSLLRGWPGRDEHVRPHARRGGQRRRVAPV